MEDVLTLRKRIYLKNKKLQNPKSILLHLQQLKQVYLKNSNPILFDTINYWENKLEEKLTQLNLIK
jgi:hypothetical protein